MTSIFDKIIKALIKKDPKGGITKKIQLSLLKTYV